MWWVRQAILFLLVVVEIKTKKESRFKWRRLMAASVGAVLLGNVFLLSYLQYSLWSKGLPGKYFLPPYQPISYFFQYSFTHFVLSFLLSLAFSGLIALVFLVLSKIRPWLLEKGEIALYFSCAMLVGWPLAVPYTAAMLLVQAICLLVQKILNKDQKRLLLNYSMLFTSVPFILAGPWLEKILDLSAFFNGVASK